jgi:hypothetical protein
VHRQRPRTAQRQLSAVKEGCGVSTTATAAGHTCGVEELYSIVVVAAEAAHRGNRRVPRLRREKYFETDDGQLRALTLFGGGGGHTDGASTAVGRLVLVLCLTRGAAALQNHCGDDGGREGCPNGFYFLGEGPHAWCVGLGQVTCRALTAPV